MKYEGKLTVLAGCLALLVGTAQAQSPARDSARDTNEGAAATSDEYSASLRYQDYLQGADLRASQIVGASVQNMEGENLGEIEELVIGANERMMVVLTVGGVLGVGEKRIAVPYDELRVSADGDTFFVNRSRATLESAPAYTYRERTSDSNEAQDAQLAARAQTDNAQNRSTTTDGAQERARAETQAENRQAENRAEAQEQRAARDAAAEAQRRETTAARSQAETEATAATAQGAALGADDHRASTIIGASVVDSAGEDVGEIDDLVVSSDTGEIQAVLSIGGLAGIGAKLVAVPFDDLQIAPGAGSADAAPRLRIDMNAQQVRDTLPEFRYERQVAQGSAPNPRG